MGENLEALGLCESFDGSVESPPLGVGAGPPLETLARRESDRTPATAVAEAWLRVVLDPIREALLVVADSGMDTGRCVKVE